MYSLVALAGAPLRGGVEVGTFTANSYTSRREIAQGGCSIGHLGVTSGTLGGYVVDDETYELVILSNNHVLANMNMGQKGDHISQPGTIFGGFCHDYCIAELERMFPIDCYGYNKMDCAIALPYSVPYDALEILNIGFPSSEEIYTPTFQDVQNKTQVQKTGSTTEHTTGYISSIDWAGYIGGYRGRDAYFYDQIIIKKNNTAVTLPGDSGSLVLTMDTPYPKICGLLFAGNSNGSFAVVNHIDVVFERLNIKLMCAAKEAVKGTALKEYIPDLRTFRDQLQGNPDLARTYQHYQRAVPGLVQAMLKKPSIKKYFWPLIEEIGLAVRNREAKISDNAIEKGMKFLNASQSVMKKRKSLFEKDFVEVQQFLKKIKGKNIKQIIAKGK